MTYKYIGVVDDESQSTCQYPFSDQFEILQTSAWRLRNISDELGKHLSIYAWSIKGPHISFNEHAAWTRIWSAEFVNDMFR